MGPPPNKDKLILLKIVYQLQNELKITNRIKNKEIKNFYEIYKLKINGKMIATHLNILTYDSAFRDSIVQYYFPEEADEITFDADKSIDIKDEKDLWKVIKNVIDNDFRRIIEKRRLIEPFWDGKRTIKYNGEKITIPRMPKTEPKVQPTIHTLLMLLLEKHGIQISRENDEGIGLLDFRCYFTTNKRIPLNVIIEFKLSHHKRIKHGIRKQIIDYLDAVDSKSGIFMVLWFKDEKGKYFKEPKESDLGKTLEWLREECLKLEEKEYSIAPFVFDVSVRPSASK